MKNDTQSELRKILVEELFVDLEADSIGPDDGLQAVAGLDSVGFLELRAHCETRFSIEITDDQFCPENFGTLGRLTRLIERLTLPVDAADVGANDAE